MKSTRHQRAWYWYDWANSAYVTTTATVLIGPYLNSIATRDACPGLATGQVCRETVNLLGIAVSPGSLASYVVTVSTLVSAIVLIIVGAIADRSPRPQWLLGLWAWTGALAAAAMFLLAGTNWQLGVVLLFIASIALGCSMVIYDGILCRIALPDDRDKVSSRGWALGYLGGGLLLAANLVLLNSYEALGISMTMSVRISLLTAGIWWGVFTLIPVLGLRSLLDRPLDLEPAPEQRGVKAAFLQLATTLRELRNYPQTLLFLVAYLFYNDGIQTVIGSSSIYGVSELGMAQGQVMLVFLVVQFVALGGALLFGRLAARFGAWRTVLAGLVVWLGVVIFGYFVPRGVFSMFLGLGIAIGVVMGGTQALSRSLYSQMVPRGRESEFFSLYQAMERGTSWFGTLAFGLVYQATHSYRYALIALIVFFVVGGLLLSRVRVRQAIEEAGNQVPAVI